MPMLAIGDKYFISPQHQKSIAFCLQQHHNISATSARRRVSRRIMLIYAGIAGDICQKSSVHFSLQAYRVAQYTSAQHGYWLLISTPHSRWNQAYFGNLPSTTAPRNQRRINVPIKRRGVRCESPWANLPARWASNVTSHEQHCY